MRDINSTQSALFEDSVVVLSRAQDMNYLIMLQRLELRAQSQKAQRLENSSVEKIQQPQQDSLWYTQT
jgi:hypothetical protein